MLLDRIVKFFTSLRLTVVLLAFAIILVFVGTVAQADEGLYQAQARYFKQWLVIGITMFGHKVPIILPGGYLIGSTLLINLVASHLYRFKLSVNKLGINVAHAGIILLLVGQLTTDIFSRETQIRFSEGETKSYAESPAYYELIFSTSVDANNNEEVVIPSQVLRRQGEIKNPQLPFSIRVKQYWHNSDLAFRAPMMQNGAPLTTNGIAVSFDFQQVPDTKKMDEKNVPTAVIEIVGPNGSLGDWVVSGWAGDAGMVDVIRGGYERQMGPEMAQNIAARMMQPQTFEIAGKKFTVTLRPERIYMPFSLTLLKATHTVYPGSVSQSNPDGIPKDFRSRVRLQNPQTGEDREVEIYMNSPLRYGGLTFYQYQMDAGEMTRRSGRTASSTLQAVRNPSWLTPYIGCIMVAIGLVIQFMIHLVRFISKRSKGAPSTSPARIEGNDSTSQAGVPRSVHTEVAE